MWIGCLYIIIPYILYYILRSSTNFGKGLRDRPCGFSLFTLPETAHFVVKARKIGVLSVEHPILSGVESISGVKSGHKSVSS